MQVLPGIVSTPGSTVTDATGQDAVTSAAPVKNEDDEASSPNEQAPRRP